MSANILRPMYVGRCQFDSYEQAEEFCQMMGLSRTLIHHKPYFKTYVKESECSRS